MPNDPDLRNLISLADAADELGLEPVSLRAAAERGTIEAVKVGGTWVTTRAAVDRYRLVNKRGRPGLHRLDTGRIHGTQVYCVCGEGGTVASLNEHLVSLGYQPVS